MKNEDLQEMRKEYIQDITLEVSKMIAKSSRNCQIVCVNRSFS